MIQANVIFVMNVLIINELRDKSYEISYMLRWKNVYTNKFKVYIHVLLEFFFYKQRCSSENIKRERTLPETYESKYRFKQRYSEAV